MSIEEKLMNALVLKNQRQLEKVFEEIYTKYYKLVYFCIKQTIDSIQDIEEITNDVFLSFYATLKVSEISHIKAYLCQSAKNKALDTLKKKKLMIEELNENNIKIETKSSYDYLDYLKENLNDKEYRILIQHVFYEDSFKEIASDMQESLNTIKSIYRRVCLKLKGLWENNEKDQF